MLDENFHRELSHTVCPLDISFKYTYPSSAQLQNNIHIVTVFKVTFKSDDMSMFDCSVYVDLLSHLQCREYTSAR